MTEADFVDIFGRLTAAGLSAFQVLVKQDGQSCGLTPQMCQTLAQRDLVVKAVDDMTHGVRLCEAGCGHVWYDIPVVVRQAYDTFSAPVALSADAGAVSEAGSEAATHDSLARVVRRPASPLWWARIMNPLYGRLDLFGQSYDQGELLELPEDVTEDAALRRLDYVMRAPDDKAYLRAQCGVCGHWFLNEHFRDKHGTLRHGTRFAEGMDMTAGMHGPDGGAALRDTTGDAADRRQWVEYPPNLEKSRASQMA